MSAVLRGETRPNIEMLLGIAAQFPAVSLCWLLTGIGWMRGGVAERGALSIDSQLLRRIGATLEAFGHEIELAKPIERYWYAAIVYARVIRQSDGTNEQPLIDDAVKLLDLILLDQEAARVTAMMNDRGRMRREGFAAALASQRDYVLARLGEHHGKYANRAFWPGSDLERDFINGTI
jgi:hypothetical protein